VTEYEKALNLQFKPPLVEAEEKILLKKMKEEAISMFKGQVIQMANPRANETLERLKKELKAKAQ
jgi:hypothetical protein